MLIDSEKLKQAILSFMPERSEVLFIVCNQPEGIVRCKDCRWFRSGLDIDDKPFATCVNTKHIRVYGKTEPDFYCGYAERKDGDGE